VRERDKGGERIKTERDLRERQIKSIDIIEVSASERERVYVRER